MAKRGRKPIAATVDDLPDGLRGEVDEALRSDVRESASSVFRRFGLAQRGLRIDTFIKYARKLREVCWTDEPPMNRETPSIEEIRAKLLVRIYESAATGNVKPYELATLYARVQEHDRIEIQRAADQRAEQKFAIEIDQKRRKLAEEKRAADEKLDAMMTEKGIPRELGDRIKDLYGLSL